MISPEQRRAIAERYATFAEVEARGVSPLYERLARAVAASDDLLAFLSVLPRERQQPNLFFAAVRHIAGLASDGGVLEEAVRQHHAAIREVMLSRRTQTNEPRRCAALLPALAQLGQPLALIEVGASAGLCLLPDRYGYDYGHSQIVPQPGSQTPPIFPCVASSATPLPAEAPVVAWRCGLDLNPLDVTSAQEMAWLETLIWPGQEARAARLREAVAIARLDPPPVIRGDLLTDLPELARQAPSDARLVVFHTAVLSYVASQADRHAFAGTVRDIGAVWISNEAPAVFPDIAALAPPQPWPDSFLLAVDGKPVAWTAPYGQAIDWFGASLSF
jgi:hypothetical protein